MSALTEQLRATLQGFGWEVGPEFERRYVTDPWVFNLANAIERLVGRIEDLEDVVSVLEARLTDSPRISFSEVKERAGLD